MTVRVPAPIGAPVGVEEGLVEAERGEADPLTRLEDGVAVITLRRDIERNALVFAQRRPADTGVVDRAAVAGIDPHRRAQLVARGLDQIHGMRVEPEFAAAGTGKVGLVRPKIRPTP